jgi:hypothetical protein
MSRGNVGPSIFVNPAAAVGPQVTAEWRRWVAENVLLRVEPTAIVDAMVREGFDRDTAVRELQAAWNHPYLAAAQGVGAGPKTGLENKLQKRDWVLEVYRRAARQATTFGQVLRVRQPSRQEFLDSYYSQNRPVVIEGALDDWPALTRWTPEYLKRRLGERVVEVQANRSSDADFEMNQGKLKKEMPFGQYVDLVESAGPTNDYYMTANNSGRNRESLQELWDDIVLLSDYLRDDPDNRGFFWYGPRGSVTPLHHDLTNNFMAQVRGRKLVRLVAPYELPDLYNHRHCYSQVNLDQVDYDRFPLFRNVKVVDVVIGPGDLLFLPVGWWHYVRGLDVTITMTFINFVFDNDFYSFYTTYQGI